MPVVLFLRMDARDFFFLLFFTVLHIFAYFQTSEQSLVLEMFYCCVLLFSSSRSSSLVFVMNTYDGSLKFSQGASMMCHPVCRGRTGQLRVKKKREEGEKTVQRNLMKVGQNWDKYVSNLSRTSGKGL